MATNQDGGVLTLDRPDASLDVIVCADRFTEKLKYSGGKPGRRQLFEELKRLMREGGSEDMAYALGRIRRIAELPGQSPGVMRVATAYAGLLIREAYDYNG